MNKGKQLGLFDKPKPEDLPPVCVVPDCTEPTRTKRDFYCKSCDPVNVWKKGRRKNKSVTLNEAFEDWPGKQS